MRLVLITDLRKKSQKKLFASFNFLDAIFKIRVQISIFKNCTQQIKECTQLLKVACRMSKVASKKLKSFRKLQIQTVVSNIPELRAFLRYWILMMDV